MSSAKSLNVLNASGYSCTKVAYSPTEAKQLVRSGFQPHVIFLDIGLPDMDGFAVARELCNLLPRRPLLVAITGHSETDGQAQREGFDLHFLKPTDPAALIDILDLHCERLVRGNVSGEQ
jgi:CheY-like chemotaxis protein